MMTYLPIVAIAISFVGMALGLFAYFYRGAQQDARHETMMQEHCKPMLDRIPGIERELAGVSADMKTFWRVLGPYFTVQLRSPLHLNRDRLLDKLDAGLIEYEEALALADELHHILDGRVCQDKDTELAVRFKLAQTETMLHQMERREKT
jgi:hypothetical protein